MAVTCTCNKIDLSGEREMDHSEAVQQMSAERFLLDELTVEERDEFEAHLFDCPECALDLRAGVAFVNEAKTQLPQLIAEAPASAPARAKRQKEKKNYWFLWQRPAFAGLAFACMLVVAYQNLVTYPALRRAAYQPRLLPSAPLHGNTRGGGHLTLAADRKHGVALPVDLLGSTSGTYSSYSVDLMDQQGKLVWSDAVATPSESESASQQYSVAIPGATLENGEYTLVVSGVAPNGEKSQINENVFEIRMTD
jgi:hypothetical protein